MRFPRLRLIGFLLTLGHVTSLAANEFNFGWTFSKGNHPGAVQPGFDDSGWEKIDLPHDWAISGPFGGANESGSTGKLPWKGEGCYRKKFELPDEGAGKRVQLLFDGVMSHPTVYLNGRKVGSWIYGYNSFWLDVTAEAKFGGENVLVVHADTREHQSRWYPGAGIYRKVTLRLVDPVHIPFWGVYVTTPEVADAKASVHVEVEVAREDSAAGTAVVTTTLLDPDGKPVGESSRTVTFDGETVKSVGFNFSVPEPRRWDIESPNLYTARTTLQVEGETTHSEDTKFGIRTFEWTADDGFHLNGRRVNLNGVNEHHTHGMLGAAFFPRAMERKFEILREMGVNALRTSHNAMAPEVLEMCDRLGIVVFNELYDKYGATAGVDVSTAEYVEKYAEREVRNFVRRDRNHPSVMIWSIANEDGAILDNSDGRSAEHVARMVGYFNKYDAIRPTIMGCHIPSGADREKGIFDALDASGWNYSRRYANFRRNYPNKPISYSETASAFATRGAYDPDFPDSKTDFGESGYLTAYVLTAAPWGDIPEHDLERMIQDDFLNGEFVWTGFDYLGEPTPVREARSSYFGIVDLAGLPKDSYHLYRSHWRPDVPTVHLTPHWNWEGREGKPIPVILYTNGDEAELFLNGRSLGRKKKLSRDQRKTNNLAFGKEASASSEQVQQDATGNVTSDHTADKAVDGNQDTRWGANDGSFPQHLTVDLGQRQMVSKINLHWERDAGEYDYSFEVSADGEKWSAVTGPAKQTGLLSALSIEPIEVRGIRVTVKSAEGRASVRELEVLEKDVPAQDPYFNLVDVYRIRWLDVPFEPGELKAVAYKDGKQIGEHSVRTAGAPARLKLSPDRVSLEADGMDLCYVTIDMVDAEGKLCPLAMDGLTFQVEGAGRFMGVANGDQMGHDTLTDKTHPLFYGKAVAVLRSIPGEHGPAVLRVETDKGMKSQVEVRFEPVR